MATEQSEALEHPEPAALKRLRRAINTQRDLPSMGLASRRLATMAASPDVRVQDLVDIAYTDPALVIRLMRLANGSTYGTRDRSEVVSVQRAIALLGHEQVGSLSRNVPTVAEKITSDRRELVGSELAQATFASHFARNLLDTRNPLVSDEGALTTILCCLAPILVATHAHHERCALRFVSREHPRLLDAISRELMGETTIQLNREIIESWSLPRSTIATIILSEQRPAQAHAGRDWLPIAVGLATRVAQAVRRTTAARRDTALKQIVRRYSHCIDIDSKRLDTMIEECAYETMDMERNLGGRGAQAMVASFIEPHLKRKDVVESYWQAFELIDATGVISRLRIRDMGRSNSENAEHEVVARNAAGKPLKADSQLSSFRTQFVSLVNEYSRVERAGNFGDDPHTPKQRIESRIIPMLLEGLRSCLGYEHASFFGRDGLTDLYHPKAGAGIDVDQMRRATQIFLKKGDLVYASMENQVVLHIADRSAPKIDKNLPVWFNSAFPGTQSFLLMPVSYDGKVRGFILAGRHCTDPEGLTGDESMVLREIRDQLAAVLAEFSADTAVPNLP